MAIWWYHLIVVCWFDGDLGGEDMASQPSRWFHNRLIIRSLDNLGDWALPTNLVSWFLGFGHEKDRIFFGKIKINIRFFGGDGVNIWDWNVKHGEIMGNSPIEIGIGDWGFSGQHGVRVSIIHDGTNNLKKCIAVSLDKGYWSNSLVHFVSALPR